MLQTQSVYPTTLELLKRLMAFEPLNQFNLVGGTALALQFGHRISVDLDFFQANYLTLTSLNGPWKKNLEKKILYGNL